ncbi:MAG: hypothetical protein QW728_00065, partial [Thermoplasmata archaeon]
GRVVDIEWRCCGPEVNGAIANQLNFSYSNFSVGQYNIELRVCDDSGAWSKPALFRLVVHEPEPAVGRWYEHCWVWAVAGIVALAVAGVVWWWRRRRKAGEVVA